MKRPTIPPGLYKLNSARVWAHTELKLIRIGGAWHVIPKGVQK